MSRSTTDFFVIYNRALNPRAETEDTKLSLDFTVELVQFLEERGHKGHYAERDAIPGANIFKELFKNIRETRKTIVVVTPEFLRNCWATYSSQAAFKELLDIKKSDKLVPIGIDITDNEKLEELNISEWIHFTHNWKQSCNPQKWNIIAQIFDHSGPLSRQPAYQEYIHAQERGDNRLRTDSQALVVQPASPEDKRKDLLTESFLQRLGEKFPAEWQIFAIKLGLPDHKVKEVERNSPGNVRMQAYNALLSWKNSYGRSEQEKVKCLLSVLLEMGRKDLAEDIEAKFQELTQEGQPNPIATEGFDEVDMGMSRNRNRVYPLNLDQPSDKQQAWSRALTDQSRALTDQSRAVTDQSRAVTDQSRAVTDQSRAVTDQSRNTGNGEQQNTTYVARELEVEKTAVIEAKPTVPPLSAPLPNTVQLQQGPSMSLPSPKVVKLPSSQSLKLPSDNENRTGMSETNVEMDTLKSQNSINKSGGGIRGARRDQDISQTENFSDIGGPKAVDHVAEVEDHISPTNTSAQFSVQKVRTSDVKPVTQLATNVSGSKTGNVTDGLQNEETDVKDVKYKSGQSLSKDDDLTADVNGSFSFNQPMISGNTADLTKPKTLEVNHGGPGVPSLNLNSLTAADTTPDSGYGRSAAETPLDEQILAEENKSLHIVNLSVTNKNQLDQRSETENSFMEAVSAKMVDDQRRDRFNQTGTQGVNNTVQEISTHVQQQQKPCDSDNLNNSGNHESPVENNQSERTRTRAELNSPSPSLQGQSPSTSSLGSRIFFVVVDMLSRPELAYS